MENNVHFVFFSLAICMPAQPPVDSQRVNAPLTGKKADQENNNFRAQGVMSKLWVEVKTKVSLM